MCPRSHHAIAIFSSAPLGILLIVHQQISVDLPAGFHHVLALEHAFEPGT